MNELTAARYIPQIVVVMTVTLKTRERGDAFRAIRKAFRLSYPEVASGWGWHAEAVAALEAGERTFRTALDFKCAVDQLWLWANQKRPRKALEDGWP